jgi:hypothetical protein
MKTRSIFMFKYNFREPGQDFTGGEFVMTELSTQGQRHTAGLIFHDAR